MKLFFPKPQGQKKNVCEKKDVALENDVKKGGPLGNEVVIGAGQGRIIVIRRLGQPEK